MGDHGMAEQAAQARPASGETFVRYTVEIDSLADFGTFIQKEMDRNLHPAVGHIVTDSPHGLTWGDWLHSPAVSRSRGHYGDAHRQAVQNLRLYLEAGAVMIAVIDRLMQTYRNSEEMARLSTQDVLSTFTAVRDERTADRAARAKA
jgi:hypothetical protein